MAFTLDTALSADAAGITDLRAQLYDTAGANVGSAISTGFVDLGSNWYHWHYASFPDGHRGGVKFYRASAPTVILAVTAINPEEGENLDTKLSLLATATALAVVAGYIDTEVAAIKAKTDNLPATPAATSDIPSAASNASTLLASVLESGKTVAQALLDLWSKEVGRATANDADAPTSITYRSPDDSVQITHTHTTTTRTP